MSRYPILPRFRAFLRPRWEKPGSRNPQTLLRHKKALPRFVRESQSALYYLDLLGVLSWEHLPERNLERNWGQPTLPFACICGAVLVQLEQGYRNMGQVWQFLSQHPGVAWVLGFPWIETSLNGGRRASASRLPTQRHLTRMLRTLPRETVCFLLDDTVRLLREELLPVAPDFGQTISLDTKHIIAWVQENNPKAYHERGRFDKHRQPRGDPDCRLGCKRRRNVKVQAPSEAPPTPHKEGVLPKGVSRGEFYWGYGSGVVVTKVDGWGEVVLAELTQPFDRPDISYFFPLMAETERRLGFRPRFGAFDAAFDAFYVYEYFHRPDGSPGFAAVPFSERGGHRKTFNQDGLPLCAADLPMPLKYRFTNRSSLVEHERGRYFCPLLYPQATSETCPVEHKNFPKGGCTTTIPTSIGTRIRYQLDRQSAAYKAVYRQRSATERVNAQAKDLGIERPKLRNGQAIANRNTLIYVLINLRTLHRIRKRKRGVQE